MIGDSASTGNAIAILVLGTIIAATLSAIRGMKTMNKAIREALDDDEPCGCEASWCPDSYAPQRNWMLPW